MYAPAAKKMRSVHTEGKGKIANGDIDGFRRPMQQQKRVQTPTAVSNQPFQRQDSFAICAELQEKDRNRSTMLDFMETTLDLSNYLQCFTELDVPGDHIDLDDNELHKAHILYDDTFTGENQPFPSDFDQESAVPSGEYNYYEQHPPEDDEEPYQMQCDVPQKYPDDSKKQGTKVIPVHPIAVAVKSESSSVPADSRNRPQRVTKKPSHFDDMMLKTEPVEDWDGQLAMVAQQNSTSSSSYSSDKKSRSRKSTDTVDSFKPQTRARKYNLKPDEEKAQPGYKLKRARNNDAVRKSRNKAKELQKQRDDENDGMRSRIRELEALLDAEKKARNRDRQLINELLQAKNCSPTPKPLTRKLFV